MECQRVTKRANSRVLVALGVAVSLLTALSFGRQTVSDQQEIGLTSPDGKLNYFFSLPQAAHGKNQPTYSITYNDQPVVLPSSLGIVLDGRTMWCEELQVRNVQRSERDTIWHPVYGERSVIRDRYRELVIQLTRANSPRLELHLIIRAYNEGIALRYFFPEHPEGGSYLRITSEKTEFTLPDGTIAYVAPFAQAGYHALPLSSWPSEAERPLTLMMKNGLYACLTEAAMVNYSRTKFRLSTDKPNTIQCSQYDTVEEITPFATPWRVVMVAEKARDLLEHNDLILNLNPPCAIDKPEWIKPGKVIREITLSTSGAKASIDFAAQHNIQFVEFDAGWYGFEYSSGSDATRVNVDPRRNPVNDLNFAEVIAYAAQKNVGIWVYVNQRALARQLDEILPLYRQWGIKGVKYGFVHVGSHRWTTWMHDAVRKAAQHHLMVDIHDEYRPTGFSRTYPNLLTQEGIRGNEEMPDATTNTIHPFTRFIAGAADYTVCYYYQQSIRGGTRFIKTTSAHQLALTVVYYSPLQFLFWYDRPSDYQNEPEVEFFEKVPTVWDETRVLQGEIGKHITVARRSGDRWFLGAITNVEQRTLDISLSFLPKGKRYQASIYSDDHAVPTRTKVRIDRKRVDASSMLTATLLPSGGQAIWLEPEQ